MTTGQETTVSTAEAYDRIAADPRFAELVARRNRFAITLSLIVLGVYISFVAVAALAPALFSRPILPGAHWSLGLIAGFGVQIFAFLMTGVYTRRANGEFDTASQAIVKSAGE